MNGVPVTKHGTPHTNTVSVPWSISETLYRLLCKLNYLPEMKCVFNIHETTSRQPYVHYNLS